MKFFFMNLVSPMKNFHFRVLLNFGYSIPRKVTLSEIHAEYIRGDNPPFNGVKIQNSKKRNISFRFLYLDLNLISSIGMD